jgi:hypothetical protein
MNESEIKKWGGIALAVIVVIFVLGALNGCVEVGGSSSDIDVTNTNTTSAEQPAASSESE